MEERDVLGDNSKIHWLDWGDGIRPATWNPVAGCTRVDEGCARCYAIDMIRRYAGLKGWPKAPGEVTYFEERFEKPTSWTKPRRIFVCSMSDLFHKDVPWWVIHNVYNEIADNERHTFFILTKRHERMVEFLGKRMDEIPRNVWHGVSVTGQKSAHRIDALKGLDVNRFVSFEPLIDPNPIKCDLAGVHWVIIGGESGPAARSMSLSSAKYLVDRADGRRVFLKQMGSDWAKKNDSKTAKGDDPSEWPEWARRREFPWEIERI